MVLRRLLPAVALAIACATVFASGPASAETLVMVSPPPELDAAVRASLAPWRVKIIVVDLASGTPAELALATSAGFVVWRDDSELVLWDAGAGVGERRDIPTDLDDANAAALALSIKTWMHLGAPPTDSTGDPPDDHVDEPPPPPPPGGGGGDVHDVVPIAPAPRLPPPLFRVEAATGARGNITDEGRAAVRASVGVVARTGPLDLAVGLELGPSIRTSDAIASGDLSTFQLTAHARWGVPVTRSLTVAPGAGFVLVRSSFSGVDDMARTFEATATVPALDAAGLIEWRRSRLVISGEIGATYVLVSQELQDRNMRLITPAHIEPRGLVRVGIVLR